MGSVLGPLACTPQSLLLELSSSFHLMVPQTVLRNAFCDRERRLLPTSLPQTNFNPCFHFYHLSLHRAHINAIDAHSASWSAHRCTQHNRSSVHALKTRRIDQWVQQQEPMQNTSHGVGRKQRKRVGLARVGRSASGRTRGGCLWRQGLGEDVL